MFTSYRTNSHCITENQLYTQYTQIHDINLIRHITSTGDTYEYEKEELCPLGQICLKSNVNTHFQAKRVKFTSLPENMETLPKVVTHCLKYIFKWHY